MTENTAVLDKDGNPKIDKNGEVKTKTEKHESLNKYIANLSPYAMIFDRNCSEFKMVWRAKNVLVKSTRSGMILFLASAQNEVNSKLLLVLLAERFPDGFEVGHVYYQYGAIHKRGLAMCLFPCDA